MEARDIGDAIITPSSSKPGCTSAHDRVHHSNKSCRVCVLPLYHWLSLGDSGIDGLEGVIRKYSVADTPEAIGKGLDTTAVWMEQRASSLRSNLYNMLIAAGPREIRSRYLQIVDEDITGVRYNGKASCIFCHQPSTIYPSPPLSAALVLALSRQSRKEQTIIPWSDAFPQTPAYELEQSVYLRAGKQ